MEVVLCLLMFFLVVRNLVFGMGWHPASAIADLVVVGSANSKVAGVLLGRLVPMARKERVGISYLALQEPCLGPRVSCECRS